MIKHVLNLKPAVLVSFLWQKKKDALLNTFYGAL